MSTALERRQAKKIKLLLDALKAAAPYVPVEIQGQVITAINQAVARKLEK